jgi:hypothetical protein
VINGFVLVAALLLGWAGAAKAVRPDDTARALRAAGLPCPPGAVRVLAVFEVAVGAGVLSVGGSAFNAAMAASYAVFAAFVGVALGRGWALSSCGCFGQADTPPTPGHLIANAVFAAAATVAAATGAAGPLSGFSHHPAQGAALALVGLVTAGLVVLALTRLPALASVTRAP